MKKIILLFFILFFYSIDSFAVAINNIVFFGDSLSDDGNLYRSLFHIVPKSPPYFKGRFSNGPTWAENLGKYYYDQSYAAYSIYAVGGATTLLHAPNIKFIAPSLLELQIDEYLLESFSQDKTNTLMAIWIGGNDYLFDQQTNVDAVIDKIIWAMNKLKYSGARNFLILNLPDLGAIPFAQENGIASSLHMLSELHNLKLDAAIQAFTNNNPSIRVTYVDIYKTVTDVMANPQKYNQKYNINLVNTSQACWQGAYALQTIVTKNKLTQELQLTLATQKKYITRNINIAQVGQFIINSPAIYHAYVIGKMYDHGMVPCPNANMYLFWDHIHPTQVAHQILSQLVIENLSKNKVIFARSPEKSD